MRASKIKVHEATAIAHEEASWSCSSCGKPVEDHTPTKGLCLYCAEYFKDMSDGIFEEPEDGCPSGCDEGIIYSCQDEAGCAYPEDGCDLCARACGWCGT